MLGIPDAVDGDRIVYLRETRHRISAKFALARKDNPEMDDKEAHELLAFSDLSTFIDARFSNSKLVYLAVSRIETH